MPDYLIQLGITFVLTALREAVKNPEKKKDLSRAMLKIRETIDIVYPEFSHGRINHETLE